MTHHLATERVTRGLGCTLYEYEDANGYTDAIFVNRGEIDKMCDAFRELRDIIFADIVEPIYNWIFGEGG